MFLSLFFHFVLFRPCFFRVFFVLLLFCLLFFLYTILFTFLLVNLVFYFAFSAVLLHVFLVLQAFFKSSVCVTSCAYIILLSFKFFVMKHCMVFCIFLLNEMGKKRIEKTKTFKMIFEIILSFLVWMQSVWEK